MPKCEIHDEIMSDIKTRLVTIETKIDRLTLMDSKTAIDQSLINGRVNIMWRASLFVLMGGVGGIIGLAIKSFL